MPPLGRPAAPAAPMPPSAPVPPAAPPQDSQAEKDKKELEKKLADMEKRLQEEREKLLVANLKSQEEAVASARVESSIKELQDKLRRERRDQEREESRVKLESKVQEMEQRLAQERETWVVTLRNQMNSRETQDREIEAHFAIRIQEMERRFLEDKAQWQKAMLAKDEENRNLRSLCEKLKGADVELQRTATEKKFLESRVNEMATERADILSKAATANERDKENIQLRADLGVARQQVSQVQERLERELQGLRISAKEREERLMADSERLGRELETAGARFRADNEAELRRLRSEFEAEVKKHKDSAEAAVGQLVKLRAVAGALEKQSAASRSQVIELQRTQERYKAEFVVLQRKWVEREKELRAEAQSQMNKMLEAEKAKIKVQSQEEITNRVSKLSAQIRAELGAEIKAEAGGEIDRLRKDMFQKDTDWSQRLLAKDGELHAAALKSDDLSIRLAREESARQSLERAKVEFEKELLSTREELGAMQALLAGLREKSQASEKEVLELRARKEELERLATAQAAQVKNVEESMDQMRGQLSRETHLTRMYLEEKQALEQKLKGGQGPA
jgi:hypothetical protein